MHTSAGPAAGWSAPLSGFSGGPMGDVMLPDYTYTLATCNVRALPKAPHAHESKWPCFSNTDGRILKAARIKFA